MAMAATTSAESVVASANGKESVATIAFTPSGSPSTSNSKLIPEPIKPPSFQAPLKPGFRVTVVIGNGVPAPRVRTVPSGSSTSTSTPGRMSPMTFLVLGPVKRAMPSPRSIVRVTVTGPEAMLTSSRTPSTEMAARASVADSGVILIVPSA